MQRWEYLEVAVWTRINLWIDSRGRSGKCSVVRTRDEGRQLANVGPLLNDLGAQGWELTGVSSETDSPAYSTYRLFMKRPAVEAQQVGAASRQPGVELASAGEAAT